MRILMKTLMIIFILTISFNAFASEYKKKDLTGDLLTLRGIDIMKWANNGHKKGSDAYMGYIVGVAEATLGLHWCGVKGVTGTQIAAVVSKYQHNHPEYLDNPALANIETALMEAFPCKK